MKTVHLLNDAKQAAGSWWLDPVANCVCVSCPECGAKGALDHAIDQVGRVSPSLVCPGRPQRLRATRIGLAREAGTEACGWHENVVLDGWPGWTVPG